MTNMTDRARLHSILQYCRPHGSSGVSDLVRDVFAGYDYEIFNSPSGEPLALIIEVDPHLTSTLFSSHLDTVHAKAGRQQVFWDEDLALFYKEDESESGCLGADDGAGVWLMLNMIDAGVPGHYFFHYGEERGGVGSRGMSSYHSRYLSQFQRAIAFDRRGTGDVITHQAAGRCCSDEFAVALSSALNKFDGMGYKPCSGGIFTDTANYIYDIGECTNLSCGYQDEHSKNEVLDFEHLSAMRLACINLSWEDLPSVRTPGEEDSDATVWGLGWGSSFGLSVKHGKKYAPIPWEDEYVGPDMKDLRSMTYVGLHQWVQDNLHDPDILTDVLWAALS